MKKLLSRLYRLIPLPLLRFAIWLCNTKFNLSVAGIFFTQSGKVLVLRHVYRRRHPWGVPSGFLNAGETAEAAALRELKEETGLSGTATHLMALQPVWPRHLEIFVVGTVEESADITLCHEIFEARFCDPQSLPEGMMPGQAEFVRRAAQARSS